MPADSRQHVWLHYDYMVTAGRSDAPDPDAMRLVVDAFADHGIDLHIDPEHTAIPEHRVIIPDFAPASDYLPCDGQATPDYQDAASFQSLRAQYFHPMSNHAWHYAIFGYYADPCHRTGIGALPGYDLVVGTGKLRDVGLDDDDPVFFARAGASVFMHELGHNLGLHHGGDVDQNHKPNYLSVMNYLFIFGGIPYASTPGSTEIAGWRLDYSERTLPTLDESHLDETKGILAGTNDVTGFAGQYGFGIGPAVGPVDWNQNGHADETDVKIDLDYTCLGCAGTIGDMHPQYEQMTGFDDWAEVHRFIADEDKHPKHPVSAEP